MRKGMLKKIAWCLFYIADVNREVAEKLARNPDIENLKNKIKLEDDIEKIGSWVGQIDWAAEEPTDELIPIVKNKIEEEYDVEKITGCIIMMVQWSSVAVSKLLSQLDMDKLKTPEIRGEIIELKNEFQE